jgi:hypothetical protein
MSCCVLAPMTMLPAYQLDLLYKGKKLTVIAYPTHPQIPNSTSIHPTQYTKR